MAETTLLPDLGTQILIPICALVGIAFALVQWLLVSKVKLSTDKSSSADGKNGFTEALIEEEDGVSDHSVVRKCADIQSAISEGGIFCPFMLLCVCARIEGDHQLMFASNEAFLPFVS
ncbi:UNVERIFIED_CONTAM: Pyrophosphate-energized vacuolar membrane proton pump [Sesamum latifolium]|uniref:H(+)-exporting diphosphatase n=1 Tax=Sesamum latifolium TaxID=2727402 RepID=A0AAW2XCI9_9LAMI